MTATITANNEFAIQISESDLDKLISTKVNSAMQSYNDRMASLTEEIATVTSQYTNFTSNLTTYKYKMDKVDSFSAFQSKANDMLTTHEIRINNLITDLSNARFKYDKIFLDNLTVPGYIGEYSKFKNLREYIDNNIAQVSTLMSYKEKTDLDMRSYRERIESLIHQFTMSINQFSAQQIKYSNEVKNETITHCDRKIEETMEAIEKVKLENGKDAIALREKSADLIKKAENYERFKISIEKRFEEEIIKQKGIYDAISAEFDKYKKEYAVVRERVADLVDFIKDVRFRRNLVDFNGISRKEIRDLTDKIDPKQKKKIEGSLQRKLDLDYDIYTGEEIKDGSLNQAQQPQNDPNELEQKPQNLDFSYNKENSIQRDQSLEKNQENLAKSTDAKRPMSSYFSTGNLKRVKNMMLDQEAEHLHKVDMFEYTHKREKNLCSDNFGQKSSNFSQINEEDRNSRTQVLQRNVSTNSPDIIAMRQYQNLFSPNKSPRKVKFVSKEDIPKILGGEYYSTAPNISRNKFNKDSNTEKKEFPHYANPLDRTRKKVVSYRTIEKSSNIFKGDKGVEKQPKIVNLQFDGPVSNLNNFNNGVYNFYTTLNNFYGQPAFNHLRRNDKRFATIEDRQGMNQTQKSGFRATSNPNKRSSINCQEKEKVEAIVSNLPVAKKCKNIDDIYSIFSKDPQ